MPVPVPFTGTFRKVPVPVPVPVNLYRHPQGAGYRHLPKGAGAGAGAGQTQPALEVPVPVTGTGGTGSGFEFSQQMSIFFAILSFFFINCPLIIPFFCLSLASSSLIKKLLIFLCPFHHFFLFLINKVYPPGSKCEALWLGFHLILLYLIRIFVVGKECD